MDGSSTSNEGSVGSLVAVGIISKAVMLKAGSALGIRPWAGTRTETETWAGIMSGNKGRTGLG